MLAVPDKGTLQRGGWFWRKGSRRTKYYKTREEMPEEIDAQFTCHY